MTENQRRTLKDYLTNNDNTPGPTIGEQLEKIKGKIFFNSKANKPYTVEGTEIVHRHYYSQGVEVLLIKYIGDKETTEIHPQDLKEHLHDLEAVVENEKTLIPL